MFKKKCSYDFELLDDGFKIDQSEIHDPYPLNRVPEDLKHSRFKISIIDPNNYEIINKIDFHSFEVVPKDLNKKIFIYDAHSNWKEEITNYCTSSFIIPQILDCPQIVKPIGIAIPSSSDNPQYQIKFKKTKKKLSFYGPMIATEFMKNGSIRKHVEDYLQSNGTKNDKMNPTIRYKIIYGIAAIMKYVHKRGFIHQQLTTENILLDDNLEPVITGFTYLNPHFSIFDLDDIAVNYKTWFTPIEFLNGEKISKDKTYFEIDVYSYGMILVNMFKALDRSFFDKIVLRSDYRPLKKEIPENYLDLIGRCLDRVPENRPTFEEITKILKDESFYLDEFEMETDVEAVKEYQERIDKLCQEPKENNIFIGEDGEKFIKEVEKIGEGGTSIAYKVVDSRSGRTMCKKVLKTVEGVTTFKDLQNAVKEFEVLHLISHPCICESIWINTSSKVKDSKDKTTVSIYLEYFKNSLKNFLNGPVINNTFKARIVVEIAHALSYLHKKGMIYRDLKIDNIMLNDVFEVKLIDFGLVKITECLNSQYSFVHETMTKGVGTFDYMSPEMLNEDDYNEKTDVYSFGILLFVIFTGSLPKIKLKDKLNGKSFQLPDESNSISKFCINLIEKCVCYDPDSRPSFDQILSDMKKNHYKFADDIDEKVPAFRSQELARFES
ncbi:hypothetical protein M9Y10_023717 [Tritrichomonas musculus]|uniref:Protein kinase domain-containing protein n=1 Tax=Tritrichomonas musculus TaxID=1915356 RepID=A0ABR2KW59_9EUKA